MITGRALPYGARSGWLLAQGTVIVTLNVLVLVHHEELKGGRAGGMDFTRSSDGLCKLRRTHDTTMRRTAQCMRSMCCRLICGDQQTVATLDDRDA